MTRAVLSRAVWALGVIAALVLSASPAVASSGGTADDTWTVSFAGSWHAVYTGADGDTDENDGENDVTLSCTPEECTYFEYNSQTELTLSAAKPTATATWDESGEVCEGPWQGGGTSTVTFAGTTLTVESHVDGSGWRECGDGGRNSIWASDTTLVGTWTEGELCTLTGDPCPGAEPAPTPGQAAGPEAPATGAVDVRTTSQLATGAAAAPSVLSGLAAPAEAGIAPGQLALAALLTVILVLLVAFPTSLLNSAVDSGSERLSAWRTNRKRPLADPADGSEAPAPGRSWSRSWWWAATGVAAASLISSFVDPQFGLNPGSGRVVLSLLVGFALDVVVGWSVVVWLMRRFVPDATHSYAFQPLSLLIVVAAVVFTRITGFEPGIVFGLVAGVAFGAVVGRAASARAALTGIGYAFALALVAWIAYGFVAPSSGDSFWTTFLVETLSSMAIGGMAALPIALFPLRGLAGHAVWVWNRWVWGGCYAVGLIAFFIVLMPMPFSWEGVHWDLAAWIGVYLAYAVVAVVAWLLLARPWRREKADRDDGEGMVAEPSTGEPEASVVAEPAGRLEE